MSVNLLVDETKMLKSMGYDYNFIDDKTKKTLNLLKNNIIVGYVEGNTDDINFKMFSDYISDYKYDIYISNVNVNEEHRNKNLCKIIVKIFVLHINAVADKQLSYLLLNTGKDIACKCYYKAFHECGYNVFAYKYNVDEGELNSFSTPIININECGNHEPHLASEMLMAFIYNKQYGGKNILRNTKKTKKTNKQKKHNKSNRPKKCGSIRAIYH